MRGARPPRWSRAQAAAHRPPSSTRGGPRRSVRAVRGALKCACLRGSSAIWIIQWSTKPSVNKCTCSEATWRAPNSCSCDVWTVAMRVAAACGTAALATAAVWWVVRSRRRVKQPSDAAPSGLIFTGTGCSSGLPLVPCALGVTVKGCEACAVALRRGASDKNWRGNVGCLLRAVDAKTGERIHVQIDCGKTFRETACLSCRRLSSSSTTVSRSNRTCRNTRWAACCRSAPPKASFQLRSRR